MGSINVALNSAALGYGGPHSTGTNLLGRDYVALETNSKSSVFIQVSGTETYTIAVLQDSTTGTQYSIDGGSFTNPNLAGSDSAWTALVINLPDTGSHLVEVNNRTQNTYLDATNGITLAAASVTPSAARPSFLGTIQVVTPLGSTSVVDEGYWYAAPGSTGPYVGCLYSSNGSNSWGLASIREKHTGPLSFWMFCGGGFVVYSVDGAADVYVNVANDSISRFVTVFTPGDGAEHDTVVYFVGGGASQVFQVAATTINAASIARRTALSACGDSNWAGAGVSTRNSVPDLTLCAPYIVARALGCSIVNRGIGFTTCAVAANNGTGLFDQVVTTKAAANHTVDIPGTSEPRSFDVTGGNPSIVLMYNFCNDMADNWFAANAANGHEVPSDLQTALADIQGYFKGGVLPALTKFLTISLCPRNDVADNVRGISANPAPGTWNAAIKDANTSTADSRFIYVPTESVSTTGIHLGNTQMAELATVILEVLNPEPTPPAPSANSRRFRGGGGSTALASGAAESMERFGDF